MGELQVRGMITGILFGLWPLFMNRSGLNANISAVAFSATALVVILPVAFVSNGSSLMNIKWMVVIGCLFTAFFIAASVAIVNSSSTADVIWKMVVAAVISGALGLLVFTSMLEKATPQNVSYLFVLMMIFQITVPAVWHIIMNGLTVSKIIGFLAAVLAAILLA